MPRIGIAQIGLTKDIGKNLSKMLTYIGMAKRHAVELLCFPEYSLNPDLTNLVDLSAEIRQLRQACAAQDIWCIFGAYSIKDGQHRDTIYLIDPQGKIAYEYDKVNLWKAENDIFTPGEGTSPIDIGICKIGIICCWDMSFPAFVGQLAQQGAQIIFCPSYLCDYTQDQDALRAIPLVRAFENCVYFVTCDALTADTLSESYMCHPVAVRAQIIREEQMAFLDVDLDELAQLRRYYGHA